MLTIGVERPTIAEPGQIGEWGVGEPRYLSAGEFLLRQIAILPSPNEIRHRCLLGIGSLQKRLIPPE